METNLKTRIKDSVLTILCSVIIICIVFIGFFGIEDIAKEPLKLNYLVSLIFTIIGIMLAIIALGGLFSWYQLEERKKKIDESLKQLDEALGESYLSLASLYITGGQGPNKYTNRIMLERARNYADKAQRKLPEEDFRTALVKGHISFARDDYEEAIRQFEISQKRALKINDPQYSSICYNLAVTCIVFGRRSKENIMEGRTRDIINWLIEAFKRDRNIMYAAAYEDPTFISQGKEQEDKNPLFVKLRTLIEDDRGITELEKDTNEIEEWIKSLSDYLSNNSTN